MPTKAKTLVHFGPGAPAQDGLLYREEFPSKSTPGKSYVAGVNAVTKLLTCGCPGWVNKREGKARHCGHTKDIAAKHSLVLEERDGQMFVVGESTVRNERGGMDTRTSIKAAVNQRTEAAMRPAPMLASPMPDGMTADSYHVDRYLMEEKYDGHRVITRVAWAPGRKVLRGKGMELTTWSRGDKTRTLPTHIASAMEELPAGVYDGELIIPGGHSYDVTAGQNSGRERLVLFDLLEALDKPTLDFPLVLRREMLETAFHALDGAPAGVVLASQYSPSTKIVEGIWADGGEGVIIKRRYSLYRPGYRTDDWIKIKATASATLTIIGYEAGKVGAYSAVKIRDADGIETTVKTLDNATMRAMIKSPDSFIGRKLVISFQERTPSGKYRHPMWDHLL